MRRASETNRITTKQRRTRVMAAAAATAMTGILAAGSAARADVLLSNYEGSLGNGVQGWFDYNGNVTNIGVTAAPTGGTTNWMHIGYTSGTYVNAGPTIQPWANSNFNNTNFQAHNFLHLDVIFPSTGPNAWLSNETLPVFINSNGGPSDGIQLGTVDTSIKDTKQHLALDYSAHKSSNGGALNVTDWMNLLFGHADEAQWAGNPFNPYVYVDNIQFTTSAALPPDPPAPGSGTWDATKSGAWSVLSNWMGGVGANGAGNTATFPQADAARTVNVDAVPISVGTLTIDSTNGYAITGNSFSIDSGDTNIAGAVNVTAASGSHTISAPLNMARSTDFTVDGTSTLTVAELSGGGFGSVNQLGTGTLNVNRLSNVSLTVNGTVNVTGSLTSEGSWVYAVTTTSPAAAVNLGANDIINNGLYGGGTVTVAAGGTLQTGNYSDYTFDGAIAGAGNVVVGHTSESIGEPHIVTWNGNQTYTGSTLVTDANTLIVGGSITGTSSLTVDGEAKVQMTPGATKVIKAGEINVSGKIDIGDNKLITSSPVGSFSGTTYTGISGLVDTGRGDAGNALWDGSGIVTSDTRAINNGDLVSIGVAKVSEVRTVADTETTTFAGQTVLGSDTLVMATWGGDANLDGKINIDDYGRIDGNVGQSGSVFGWDKGDFNYDGKINIDDYGIIDGNINRQGTPFVTAGSATSVALEGASAVPEPASLGAALSAATAALLRRRRRRSR